MFTLYSLLIPLGPTYVLIIKKKSYLLIKYISEL